MASVVHGVDLSSALGVYNKNNMSPKSTTFIIPAVLATVLLIALGVILWFRMTTPSVPGPSYTNLPNGTNGATSTVASSTHYITLKLASSTITMRDPRQLPETQAVGSGNYQLTSLANTSSKPFGVVFNENNGSFAIGLEKEPLAAARSAAEEYLRTTLGVSDAELCNMNIYVGTTYRINQFYAGKNLGLSFCPGSTPLQ